MKDRSFFQGIEWLCIFSVLLCACSTPQSRLRSSISSKIEDRESDFRRCYNEAKTPGKAGTVVVAFEINLKGKVSNALVTETTLRDPGIEHCVLGIIKTIQFDPPSQEKTLVTYPFSYQK